MCAVGTNSSLSIWQNLPVKPAGPGAFYLERFSPTNADECHAASDFGSDSILSLLLKRASLFLQTCSNVMLTMYQNSFSVIIVRFRHVMR